MPSRHLFWKNRKQTDDAYLEFAKRFKIDIKKQSIKNFQRLIQEVKNKQLLTQDAWVLFDVWREHLVPLFTLKHATSQVDFNELKPLSHRQAENDLTHNSHTAWSVMHRFSHFVLNMGDTHQTPMFLGNNVETIQVNLSKIDSDSLKGLWVSNHFNQVFSSEQLPPVRFGECTRMVEFDGTDLSKTYSYHSKEGIITRKTFYQDEIFAATRNIHSLFDALFFQFLLELHYLGSFKQKIFEAAKNKQIAIIQETFLSLFTAWVYPEAKLPLGLDLTQPGVQIVKKTLAEKQLEKEWFECVEYGKLKKLKELYEKNPNLIDVFDQSGENGLLVAIKSDSDKEIIEFLIEKGSKVIEPNTFFKVNALEEAIKSGKLKLIEALLQGTSNAIFPDIKHPAPITSRTYRAALHLKDPNEKEKVFELIKKYDPNHEANLPSLASFYQNGAYDFIPKIMEQYKKSIDEHGEWGKPMLVLATENNDAEWFYFCLDRGAKIDQALYVAIEKGNLTFVKQLIEKKADLNQKNSDDLTPYEFLLQQIEQNDAKYEEQKKDKQEREARTQYALKQIDPTLLNALFDRDSDDSIEQEKKQMKENLLSIKKYLDSINPQLALQPRPKKYLSKNQFVVGIVTATLNKKPHVLLIRKKHDVLNAPVGFWLAPGGGKDEKDANWAAAAKREVEEETSIKLDHAKVKEIYSFQQEITYKQGSLLDEFHFFHFDLGEIQYLDYAAQGDVAAIDLVPYEEIKKLQLTKELKGYYYRGIRINQSNMFLIETIFQLEEIDKEQMDGLMMVERYGSNMLASLVAHPQTALNKILAFHYVGLDLAKTDILFLAYLAGKKDWIDILLMLGADVYRIPQNKSLNLLNTVISLKDYSFAKHLIEIHHFDINLLCKGNSALIAACCIGDPDFVRYLIVDRGAKLHQGIGGAALNACIDNNQVEAAKILLETKKIDLNSSYEYFDSRSIFSMSGHGNLPLLRAFTMATNPQKNYDLQMMELLLKAGANPEYPVDLLKQIKTDMRVEETIAMTASQQTLGPIPYENDQLFKERLEYVQNNPSEKMKKLREIKQLLEERLKIAPAQDHHHAKEVGSVSKIEI